jgi:O-antigen/teichoic acid export membrane protein
VFLAKSSSPEIVGQFTLAVAATSPIVLLTNLNLRSVQVTDSKQQYLFRDYLELRLITTLIAVLIIAGVSLSYTGMTGWVVFLVGCGKSIEAVSDIFQGLLQQHERMDRVAKSIILRSIASMVMTVILLTLTRSLSWAIVGGVIVSIAVLFGYDIPMAMLTYNSLPSEKKSQYSRVKWILCQERFQKLSKLAIYAFPVGLLMMMLSLTINVPRYVIEEYLGQRALGIFSAIAYLPVIGNTFINALGQSSLPRLSKYYLEKKDQSFKSLLIKMLLIGLGIGLIGFLVSLFLGKQLLENLYQPEYAQYSSVLLWLMAWGIFLYISSLLAYGVSATRYFKLSLVFAIILCAGTFGFCTYLVPKYGILGSAIALVISAGFHIICNALIVRHAMRQIRE